MPEGCDIVAAVTVARSTGCREFDYMVSARTLARATAIRPLHSSGLGYHVDNEGAHPVHENDPSLPKSTGAIVRLRPRDIHTGTCRWNVRRCASTMRADYPEFR